MRANLSDFEIKNLDDRVARFRSTRQLMTREQRTASREQRTPLPLPPARQVQPRVLIAQAELAVDLPHPVELHHRVKAGVPDTADELAPEGPEGALVRYG